MCKSTPIEALLLTTKNAKNKGKQLGIFVFRVIFVVKEMILPEMIL
jgi:hypothetical protein